MSFAQRAYDIFAGTTAGYHTTDNVDAPFDNHYTEPVDRLLAEKNWVDAVQWHLEDIIRDPAIDPVDALALKRRIDRSNQVRTDMVEDLDTYFLDRFGSVEPSPDATINTESPAWALDRLSILALKIYHMAIEASRPEASDEHRARCASKLAVLEEQRRDLISAIDNLIDDYAAGRKYMKVYRQMKMYNDPSTNPVLYADKK